MNRIIKVALVALLWIIVTTSAVDLGGDTSRRLDMAHAWWTGQPEMGASQFCNE
ncbi:MULTISPECIES: hypothetical protein [Microcystis]|jgi:hypothetical protein|uniref:Uncharacterized protein n=1 Tax=Microcystis aeruginosa (strain NIES-843 / IAM M-2473) TaxID=449447 RepID=B0JRH0_MICAN|nr:MULTISPECIES: hypothetical protein [Microcystis]BAG00720.1 unknown protein [Microcystis aeruginosa NIES-843]